MSDKITVRAKRSGSGAWVEILVRHASRRRQATHGESEDEIAFEHLSFLRNNSTVAEVYTSRLIADVPLTTVEIDCADNGDTITVDWTGANGEFATDTIRFDTE